MGKMWGTKCPSCGHQGVEKESNPDEQFSSGFKGVYLCRTPMNRCRVDFYFGDSVSVKEGW